MDKQIQRDRLHSFRADPDVAAFLKTIHHGMKGPTVNDAIRNMMQQDNQSLEEAAIEALHGLIKVLSARLDKLESTVKILQEHHINAIFKSDYEKTATSLAKKLGEDVFSQENDNAT